MEAGLRDVEFLVRHSELLAQGGALEPVGSTGNDEPPRRQGSAKGAKT